MAVTGKTVAHMASDIMETARNHRGPIFRHGDEILAALHQSTDDDVLNRLDGVLRPYIDAAESVAASALTQREPK